MRYYFYIFVAAACFGSSSLVSAAPVSSNDVVVSTIPTRSFEDQPKRTEDADAKSESGIQDLRPRAFPPPSPNSGIARRSFSTRSSTPTPSDWEYVDTETESWGSELGSEDIESESGHDDPLTAEEQGIYAELLELRQRILEKQGQYRQDARQKHERILSVHQSLVNYQGRYLALGLPKRAEFAKEREQLYNQYAGDHRLLQTERDRFERQRKEDYNELRRRAAVIGFHERPSRAGGAQNIIVDHFGVTINGVRRPYPPSGANGWQGSSSEGEQEGSLQIPSIPYVPGLSGVSGVGSCPSSNRFEIQINALYSLSSFSSMPKLPALYHTRTLNQAQLHPPSSHPPSRPR